MPGTVYMKMGTTSSSTRVIRPRRRRSRLRGFFTAGDIGYLDEDGFLFLCDRKSDMIISGGVNIYPAEVEAELIMHPGVADVAVFGIPDDEWGERVMAVMQPAAGRSAGAGSGRGDPRVAGREAGPAEVADRRSTSPTEMPRDPSGKLLKRRLREPYWQARAGRSSPPC